MKQSRQLIVETTEETRNKLSLLADAENPPFCIRKVVTKSVAYIVIIAFIVSISPRLYDPIYTSPELH